MHSFSTRAVVVVALALSSLAAACTSTTSKGPDTAQRRIDEMRHDAAVSDRMDRGER